MLNWLTSNCCCWYHKGTNFQANHNLCRTLDFQLLVVADTTKVRIFKQITTSFRLFRYHIGLLLIPQRYEFSSKSQLNSGSLTGGVCCCWYHKGTNFQANHNGDDPILYMLRVVADTTKVRIFKQITTTFDVVPFQFWLLLIPQRYEFSSKSQRRQWGNITTRVVADTTKVRIFKQITTGDDPILYMLRLLLIPQRYEFSSKSQLIYRYDQRR